MLLGRALAATSSAGSRDFLSFHRFLLRAEVLQLYRNVQRALRRVPDQAQREELRQWARAEFEAHRHHQDEETIRGIILMGNRQFRELQKTIAMASS